MSGHIAYCLLKNASLKQSKKQLIKATIRDLRYGLMKELLKKIFSDLSSPSCSTMPLPGESVVKTEETYQINCKSSDAETEDVLYTKSRNNRDRKRISSIPQTKKRSPHPLSYHKPQKGRNPIDSRGNITRCTICEYVNHWDQSCPDKNNKINPNETWISYKAVLFQSDFDNLNELKGLLSESWSAAVLDSGASKTVCGKVWLDSYLDSSSENGLISSFTAPLLYTASVREKSSMPQRKQILVDNANHKITIEADVIDSGHFYFPEFQ